MTLDASPFHHETHPTDSDPGLYPETVRLAQVGSAWFVEVLQRDGSWYRLDSEPRYTPASAHRLLSQVRESRCPLGEISPEF